MYPTPVRVTRSHHRKAFLKNHAHKYAFGPLHKEVPLWGGTMYHIFRVWGYQSRVGNSLNTYDIHEKTAKSRIFISKYKGRI